VEVDILYNPATRERIYDVLKVAAEQPPARVAPEPSGEFSLENVHVTINGKDRRGTAQYLDEGKRQ